MHELVKLPKSHAKAIAALCRSYHSAPIIQGGGDTPEKIAARKAFSEKSAWLAKKHFGLTLTPEEAFLAVHYNQSTWTMLNPGTLAERLTFLSDTLTGKIQIDEEKDEFYSEKSPEKIFSTLYFWHDYASLGNRKVKTVEFGSTKFKKPPASLYRLIYLFQPAALDFSDMYKSGEIAAILSPSGEFTAAVEFWKYELALRFTAAQQHLSGRPAAIQCGVPGAGTGMKSGNPLLYQWTSTLVLALNTPWDIYSGNNFTV